MRGQAYLLFTLPELKTSLRGCAWVEALQNRVAPRLRNSLDNNEQQPSLNLWFQMFAIVLSVWVESILQHIRNEKNKPSYQVMESKIRSSKFHLET